MVLTVQISLIVLMVISFFGVIGESNNEKLRDNMAAICIASIIALVVLIWIG